MPNKDALVKIGHDGRPIRVSRRKVGVARREGLRIFEDGTLASETFIERQKERKVRVSGQSRTAAKRRAAVKADRPHKRARRAAINPPLAKGDPDARIRVTYPNPPDGKPRSA